MRPPALLQSTTAAHAVFTGLVLIVVACVTLVVVLYGKAVSVTGRRQLRDVGGCRC